MVSYSNPIISGFFPDPSICRVGGDYYLVTSTFEYFPGVALLHSTDLVHFEHIGNVLTRASQLDLEKTPSSFGIFAPTLRYHEGVFYLVTTNVGGGGNFYVTSTDPRGPFSEPVWLDDPTGVDPSLFFDDDGTVYYTRQGGAEIGGIYLSVLDLHRGRLLAPPKLVWTGSGGTWPEGPHLYKRGGFYYLLISEGGTGYEHMLTVARAGSPFGPYEAYARNPVLSHRTRASHAIQATGHGDWVQTPDGNDFVVFLGIRPRNGRHHHLGRETFLAPMSWSEDGWPVVGSHGTVELEMEAMGLPNSTAVAPTPTRDDFDSAKLAPFWSWVRTPRASAFTLSEKPGVLRLFGTSATLDEVAPQTFVGQRQRHFHVAVRARLAFTPRDDGSEAGLCLRANDDNHYDLVIARSGSSRTARLRLRIKGQTILAGAPLTLADGPLRLSIHATQERYDFAVQVEGHPEQVLGTAETTPLSSESAGTFTGVMIGMFACAKDGETAVPADFDWFEYVPAAEQE
ncbi:MAG: glycoside hydrolase family 43 protein [Polyangiaceae bacterium]